MSEQFEDSELSPDIQHLLAELSQAMALDEANADQQLEERLNDFAMHIVKLQGALIATQLILPYLVDGLADIGARFRQPGIFRHISGLMYEVIDRDEQRAWAAAFTLIAEQAGNYGVSCYERHLTTGTLSGEADIGFAAIRSVADQNRVVIGVFNSIGHMGSVAFQA